MKTHNKKNIDTLYFIASPNLGTIDMWLPVILQLKNEFNIVFVIPSYSIASTINGDSVLIKISDSILDGVLLKSYSGLWIKTSSLIEAKNVSSKSYLFKYIQHISGLLSKGRFSKFYLIEKLGSQLQSLLHFIDKVIVIYNPSISNTKNNPFKEKCAILYDVYIESKEYSSDIFKHLRHVKKFSIPHGIGADPPPYSLVPNLKKREDVVVYVNSSYEINLLHEKYNIPKSSISLVGITKHDENWIDYLLKSQISTGRERLFDEYVFLVGRNTAPYFPHERKVQALTDIRDAVFDKLKMKIVIKYHPKEVNNSFGNNIYEEVFGLENYGIKWVFSNYHAFEIAKHSTLAICFFSSVAVDLVRFGVPVIEYLNLEGLNKYVNNKSLRDENNSAVFIYRYLKVVVGVENYEQLLFQLTNIVNNRGDVVDRLQGSYESAYPLSNKSASVVAQDIISRLK